MKKIFCILLCSAMILTSAPLPAEADNGYINVYNWGQYISDGTDDYIDINAAFTKATGIKVNYMTFDSNESLYTKLKTGGSTYDVLFQVWLMQKAKATLTGCRFFHSKMFCDIKTFSC